MRKIPLGLSGLEVPAVAVGCMRIAGMEKAEIARLIGTAMEAGANFFDHADIYGGGASEERFAEAVGMTPSVRETMILQSKCGIRQGEVDGRRINVQFDFSREYILNSVDGILRRLKTDYLDILLLHRPDALAEPEEVAAAFDALRDSGKVRHFGVSNQTPMQMKLLKKCVKQTIVANQLQLSAAYNGLISRGFFVNMQADGAVDRDGDVLDYCRLHDITVQPWSPFQHGFFEGVFLGSDKFPELNKAIRAAAETHGVSDTTIAMAFLLRHPARMQPVTGTTKPQRLADCLKAAEVTLSREEWYGILRASGIVLP